MQDLSRQLTPEPRLNAYESSLPVFITSRNDGSWRSISSNIDTALSSSFLSKKSCTKMYPLFANLMKAFQAPDSTILLFVVYVKMKMGLVNNDFFPQNIGNDYYYSMQRASGNIQSLRKITKLCSRVFGDACLHLSNIIG